MPIHQAADQDQRGAGHIAWLESEFENVSSLVVDLTPSFDGLSDALAGASGAPFGGLSLANARARLRMTTLYAVATERRALVAGTHPEEHRPDEDVLERLHSTSISWVPSKRPCNRTNSWPVKGWGPNVLTRNSTSTSPPGISISAFTGMLNVPSPIKS